MRRLRPFFFVAMLSHCAYQHQPSAFEPHFPKGPERLDTKRRGHMAELEAKTVLSVFEKKRLFDLYRKEQSETKPESQRYLDLENKMGTLRPDVETFEKEVYELQAMLREKTEPPVEAFTNLQLKKVYQSIQKLWNSDENNEALLKLEKVFTNTEWIDALTEAEQIKLYNLHFRILMDLGNFERAFSSYKALRSVDDCSSEASQAGLWMALLAFVGGDSGRALNLLEGQCDKDKSPLAVVRRKYWVARFKEANWELSSQIYQEIISQAKFPAYYQLLAQARLGDALGIPLPPETRPAIELGPFKLNRSARSFVQKAEESLKVGLRREPPIFLLHAIRLLKDNRENLTALLYVARLLKASGEHLEAMKLYGHVTSWLDEDPHLSFELVKEVYPKPYDAKVGWHCRMWKVDPDFVYSIMRQESAFNPGAISRAEAKGLLQMMPFLGEALSQQWGYGPYFREQDLLTVEENCKLSIYHMYQLERITPHPFLIAASYNAGIERVSRWWKRYEGLPIDVFAELIPINETRNYVKVVLRNLVYYKALHRGGKIDKHFIAWDIPPYQEIVVSPPIHPMVKSMRRRKK